MYLLHIITYFMQEDSIIKSSVCAYTTIYFSIYYASSTKKSYFLGVKYDESGLPIGINYDKKRRLYYEQVDIPSYTSKLSDGTEVELQPKD